MRRNRTAAFQVNGPMACLPLYALYWSSVMGLMSSGGGVPEDEGTGGALGVDGDDDDCGGDVSGEDCVGGVVRCEVGVSCVVFKDELVLVGFAALDCGGFELACADMFMLAP